MPLAVAQAICGLRSLSRDRLTVRVAVPAASSTVALVMLTVGAASLSVIVMVAGGVVPWVTIGGLVRLTDSDS